MWPSGREGSLCGSTKEVPQRATRAHGPALPRVRPQASDPPAGRAAGLHAQLGEQPPAAPEPAAPPCAISDPRGPRSREGGTSARNAARTVFRANPNRRAISLIDTPSARCSRRTSAHSSNVITPPASTEGVSPNPSLEVSLSAPSTPRGRTKRSPPRAVLVIRRSRCRRVERPPTRAGPRACGPSIEAGTRGPCPRPDGV